jgi:FkbM family methyltransferase
MKQQLETLKGSPAAAAQGAVDDQRSDRRQALRARIIELGIRAVWGESAFPAKLATGIPLISTGLRLAWLKAVGAVGINRFTAKSGLGYDFVCHIGDLAEFPFYHRRAFQNELAICAAWLQEEVKPIVFDVGANVGVFCTQLAQMVGSQNVAIYAFEPVNTTFVKLVQSIQDLDLTSCIHPVSAAMLDESRPVLMKYSPSNSLCAQVATHNYVPRTGEQFIHAAGLTLDGFHRSAGVLPTLLKIDVEGYEIAVLRGAQEMLSRLDRPALAFEFYPDALAQCGARAETFYELLSGYALYYVDDFEGQRKSFGHPIARLAEIQWGCNLFAVPLIEGSSARWASALKSAHQRIRERE